MTRLHDLRLEVAWIPVQYLDGSRDTLPLQKLLEDAHLIREVEGEPAQWAALMRFLPSVTALIARQEPRADFDAWALDGFPAVAINSALGDVAEHLWLRHPDTPFMQEPLLATTGTPYPTEWLHLTVPAPNSKAWWGKPGDRTHPEARTVARVALGLVTSWYFNPGVGGKAAGTYTDAPDIPWRPRGTLGVHNHGLRVFHRGATLAATLLANTIEAHVTGRGKNLPLWAAGPDVLPSAGPLTASTWTGSVYLLAWDRETPIGVHVGGRRHPGYSADPAERTRTATAIEKNIWRADPTIPRSTVVKAGEETGDVRPLRALHPAASAMQWAAEWYAADSRRQAARAMDPGLIDVAHSDTFSIRLDGPLSACEVSHIGRIGELSDVAAPGARARLLSLSTLIVTPVRSTLFVGLAKALGQELAKPLHEKLFAAFCADADPVLDSLLHAPAFTREHAEAFTGAAVTAFERFVGPYMTPQSLAGSSEAEGIATGIAFVRRRVAATLRAVPA